MLKYILFLLIWFSGGAFGQENPGGGDKSKVPSNGRIQKKAARKKWKEQRKHEKAEKKAVRKKQKQLQTKKTRKRMKRDKRKAMRNNQHKKEFFLKRWFGKKQR